MRTLTEAQLRANRANAAKSTGPVTAEGKARSSRNASRHGLLAKQILLQGEDPRAFQTLMDTLTERLAPKDGFEDSLIEELTATYWRLKRAWCIETKMLEDSMAHQTDPKQLGRTDAAFGDLASQPKLQLLYRYESRLHLMYQRTLKNLLYLRNVCQPSKSGTPQHPELPNEPITPNHCNESPCPAAPESAQTNRNEG